METNTIVDKLSNLAYGSIQWQDGEIAGYDIEMFESGAKVITMSLEAENAKLKEMHTNGLQELDNRSKSNRTLGDKLDKSEASELQGKI